MTLHILIADDERAARFGMTKALSSLPCRITEAEDGHAALQALRTDPPDLVFLDLDMPGLGGSDVLEQAREITGTREVIVVTADDSIESAIACMRLGATDYLTKPFELERLRAIARRNLSRYELQDRVRTLQDRLDERTAFGSLVGLSRPMRELFGRIERAAPAPLDVLIQGETGTGKELIARELHRLGGRSGPFVSVNTAAISESLAESELFGHEKGAFTGADQARAGVFEQADGGTLFLDEIGDMPVGLQAKILRALQERQVQPVGGARQVSVDVRVVSATHQDLDQAVNAGHFRSDLLYRLAGITLTVPPLRSRHQDVALLAEHFLERLAATSGIARRLGPDAMRKILAHHWPGNVRELEHVVRGAASMAGTEEIEATDLQIREAGAAADPEGMPPLDGLPLTEAKSRLVGWFERRAIERALAASEGNVSSAARSLGIHRQSLQQKMAQLGIARPR